MVRGSSHTFSEIYLHVNWHCVSDQPMIGPEIEPNLYELIEEYCRTEKGVHYHKVNGSEDHVHLVFQMEPFVLLSEFLGKVKGYSSHEVNKVFGPGTLKWQRGYGIVSFSKKHLAGVVQCVDNQKEHHGEGTTNRILEMCGMEGPEGND